MTKSTPKDPNPETFNLSPHDLNCKIRDDLLPAIAAGLNPIQEDLIPYLEFEAIRILRNGDCMFKDGAPELREDRERWRLWWLNEAFHLSHHYGEQPLANESLSREAYHAVNVLTTASALRGAIESNKTEEASAISILLALEALQGGYLIPLEKAKAARDKAEKTGIGKRNAGYAQLKQACVAKAAEIWTDDPTKRIGEVVQDIFDRLIEISAKRKAEENFDQVVPAEEIIREWLKVAHEAGRIRIPPAAQKGGRPKKKNRRVA